MASFPEQTTAEQPYCPAYTPCSTQSSDILNDINEDTNPKLATEHQTYNFTDTNTTPPTPKRAKYDTELPAITYATRWRDLLTLTTAMADTLTPNTNNDNARRVPYTYTQVGHWLTEARTSLGDNVHYDESLFATLNLKRLTATHYTHNDAALSAHSLDSLLRQAAAPIRNKGATADELRERLHGTTHRHKIVDILKTGQRATMLPTFVPNGGRELAHGGSYATMLPICNHAIVEMIEAGRAIAFSKDALQAHGCMEGVHVSPLVWAPKAGKIMGRVCFDGSKASKNFPASTTR